jgi:hypothetical protein
VDLDQVHAVWFRRPGAPTAGNAVVGSARRRAVESEAQDVAEDLWDGLDASFFPAPRVVIRRASHKMRQLAAAVRVGFEVPDTLVSTDPDEAWAFVQRHPGNVVTKTAGFTSPWPVDGSAGCARYTRALRGRDLVNLDAVRDCPIIFQQAVPKAVELRVTVVGASVFAAELHTQGTAISAIDSRLGDHHTTDIRPHSLPQGVAQSCRDLVEALDLSYGALDLVVTPDGRYVFLEINPNGQWLWTEERANLPISTAIADALTVGAGPPAAATATGWKNVELAAVLGALTFLRTTPPAALASQRAVAGLKAAHPDTAFRMSIERRVDGALDCQVLTTVDGNTTLLATSTGAALPWPMKDAMSGEERVVATVNGLPFTVDMLLQPLNLLWGRPDVADQLIESCVLRQLLDVEEPAPDDQTRITELRRRVVAPAVDEYWLGKQADWDEVVLARWSPEVSSATDPFAAVAEALRTGRSGDLVCRRRRDLPRWSWSPGEVVGPVEMDGETWMVCTLWIRESELNDTTRRVVEQVAWRDWLARQRQAARVDWNWQQPKHWSVVA